MSEFDFGKYKVFACDTSPEVIDITRSTYLDCGIGDFVATPSPKEALKHIPQMKPDLILMALKFPDINGIQVIQQIRAINDGEFYKTPILMLLDKVSQNLLREACRVGIEGALRKPISPEKVLRFSRAVLTKPRRFICVSHYFGPERRMREDPHFEGDDRRGSSDGATVLSGNDLSRKRPSPAAGGGSGSGTKAGVVLKSQDKPAQAAQEPDWGQSRARPQADGGTMDFGASTSKSSSSYEDVPTSGTRASSAPADDLPGVSSGPIETADDNTPAFEPSKTIETKEGMELVSADTPAKDEPVEAKSEAAKEDKPIETAPVIEETGPDDDNFEEIVDLDECLEAHKMWINSGGKDGQQAKRPHSNFEGQEIEGADFTGAILPQSNFQGVNCKETVFRKSDLSGSTFKDALLMSADLRVCRLAKANLSGARLDRANLLGADLSGANLAGANLRGANLSGANLTRTNLCGVNLSTATGLIPEQVSRAITDPATRLPLNARTA